jgi:hypothetical protein
VEESNLKNKRKVHRSPNYPALSLGDAIEKARRIYDAEKRTPASADTILAHLGYKPGAGPGYRSLSALRHYGLLEEHSGQDRISDAAFHILTLSDGSPDRQQAIREAALRPTIFRQVMEHYGGQLPSDLNLRDYLIRTHDFNPDSVPYFIRALRSTAELAKLGSEDHNESNTVQLMEQPAMSESVQQTSSKMTSSTSVSIGEQELFRSKLSPQSTVRVLVTGPAGPRELDKLIRLLQLQKEVMEEGENGAERHDKGEKVE